MEFFHFIKRNLLVHFIYFVLNRNEQCITFYQILLAFKRCENLYKKGMTSCNYFINWLPQNIVFDHKSYHHVTRH